MKKTDKMPIQEENQKGLHQKYLIQKILGKKVSGEDFFGNQKYELITESVDKSAEYFVLRLDTGGSDINHIKVCRISINAYADAIETTMPDLSKDLRKRYPLL